MVGGISNISMPSINHFAVQGRKMSLPVDSSSLIYSHFKHVSGVPAPDGSNGVSISKLNLLDVLIGQLNQIKNSATPISSATGERLDAAQIETLIDTYTDQIRQLKAASATMPYIHAPSAHSGIVFSLAV